MKVWLGIGALLLALIVGAQFITIFVVTYWRVTRGADRRHSSPYKAELYRQRGRLLRPNNGWCQPSVPGCRPRQGHEGNFHSPASSLFGDPYQISTGGKHYDR